MRGIKNKFLWKLSLCISILVIIPITFLLYFFGVYKKEYDRKTELYYQDTLEEFREGMESELHKLFLHAVFVFVNSKEVKSIFHNNKKVFLEDSYNYYLAVQEINDKYTNYDAQMFGIYYYELDRIISSSGSTTQKQFVDLWLCASENEEVERFFSVESYYPENIIWATTNGNGSGDGDLLMGYCTEFGKNKEKVLLFYRIQPDDYVNIVNVVYRNPNIRFFVLDSESDRICLAVDEASAVESTVFEDSSLKIDLRKKMQKYPFDVGISISEDELRAYDFSFSEKMLKIVTFMSLILLVISVIVLYYIYRPIKQMVKEICRNKKGDVFYGIKSVINEKEELVQKQEIIILELYMKHLLYGKKVSINDINKLSASYDIKCYCVFCFEEYILNDSKIKQIKEIGSVYGAWIFCVEVEPHSALIVLLKENIIGELQRSLVNWAETYSGEGFRLYTGEIVYNAENIKSSFESCLQQMKARAKEKKSKSTKEEQQQILKTKIIEYLEDNFTNQDMSQSVVADEFAIPNYLVSQIFKSQVEVGFSEYLNARRLGYAKELLAQTSYSIKEVALMSGYSDEKYFYRIFKKVQGVSPKTYREELNRGYKKEGEFEKI